MTLLTPNWDIPYAESTDHARVWEHMEATADAVESALDTIALRTITRLKTAGEQHTNNTFQDDNDLVVNGLAAGEWWRVLMELHVETPTAALSKFLTVGPTSSEFPHAVLGPASATTTATGAADWGVGANHANDGRGGMGTQRFLVMVRGTLYTGVGGTFKLQWAQTSSNATAMQVHRGSYMIMNRLL